MRKVKLLFIVGMFSIAFFQCAETKEGSKEKDEYPILETMGYYQRFSHKLYLAGRANNWELADFYTHELEEVTEELVEGNVIHDDYNLSNLSGSMLLPKIEKMQEAIRLKDEVLFLDNYELLISSCNLCHQATKHAFIKITTPTDSSTWNQDFSGK